MVFIVVLVFMMVFKVEVVSGMVFEDLNGNGVYDFGELGLLFVCVLDGKFIVFIDVNGKYVIELFVFVVIFIIKLVGYVVFVNKY